MIQQPSPSYAAAALRASSIFRTVAADLNNSLPCTTSSTSVANVAKLSQPLRCNLFGSARSSSDHSPFPGLPDNRSHQTVPPITDNADSVTPMNIAETEF